MGFFSSWVHSTKVLRVSGEWGRDALYHRQASLKMLDFDLYSDSGE